MNFDLNKYKYYTNGKEVIAVSTYAGKRVRGVAKCDPRDDFNLTKGQEIAAARCNAKIAKKRLKRAAERQRSAEYEAANAETHLYRMQRYYNDSYDAYLQAIQGVDDAIEGICY